MNRHFLLLAGSTLAALSLSACQSSASSIRLVESTPQASTAVRVSRPSAIDLTASGVSAPATTEAGTPVADSIDREEWSYVIAPYAWLLSLDGAANINGQVVDIDEDFSDLFENISIVLEGRFEAWKGKWGIITDITYSRMESDVSAGGLEAETTSDLILGVLAGGYRFVDQAPDADGVGGVTVDGIFGVGYTSLDADLDISGGPSFDGDDSWTDPIVGLRTRWKFNEKWGGQIEAVIGGFELFDGSELFTMFTTGVGYQLTGNNNLFLGWRNLDIDYSGNSSLDADIRFTGPIFGAEWSL